MEDKIIIFTKPDNLKTEKFSNTRLKDLPVGMVYAPMQPYGEVFSQEESLQNGTLFKNLNLPFMGYKRGSAN